MSKRAKTAKSSKTKESSSSKTKTLKDKRADKISSKQQPNNKGLIGAATMLSVVGMLNYMG